MATRPARRCTPSILLSLVVVGAVLLAGLNICVVLISFRVSSQGYLHTRPTGYVGNEIYKWDMPPREPLLEPTTPCPVLRMSQPQEGQFQTVIKDKVYVYSAFLDKATIRIIALRRVNFITQLKCQVWNQLQEGHPVGVADATMENLPEDHERRFTAAFIICRLPRDAQNETPYAVSVLASGDPCPEVTNTLLVQPPGQMTSEFTVCVTPLNFRYSRAYELVEWIELSRLLGADKMVFYNHSTGPNVDKVLEMYMKEGLVDIHPWIVPIQTDTWPPTKKPEIHYFAQIASLNDCLYRYKNRSRYLVYQDLDEFIIPRSSDTWAEMIQGRQTITGDASAFMFRCVFFRKEWFSPAENFQTYASTFRSIVLTYTKREATWQLPGVRSKFIVNPRTTSSVGVHFVWEASHQVDHVSEEVASVHHYRNWDRPTDSQRQVEDLIVADKYGVRLVGRLEKAWSNLAGVPMDINITIYGSFV